MRAIQARSNLHKPNSQVTDLGRLERVVLRERYVQEEHSSLIWRSCSPSVRKAQRMSVASVQDLVKLKLDSAAARHALQQIETQLVRIVGTSQEKQESRFQQAGLQAYLLCHVIPGHESTATSILGAISGRSVTRSNVAGATALLAAKTPLAR